jgi:hypothetical protein
MITAWSSIRRRSTAGGEAGVIELVVIQNTKNKQGQREDQPQSSRNVSRRHHQLVPRFAASCTRLISRALVKQELVGVPAVASCHSKGFDSAFQFQARHVGIIFQIAHTDESHIFQGVVDCFTYGRFFAVLGLALGSR